MSGISVSRTKDGEALPIVSPGVSIGSVNLADTITTFRSAPVSGTAVYIFCKSIIHFSEGQVTDESAPIDARGGVYLDVNRGSRISVKLMNGESAAKVWIFEVK